jgi:MFS family permease
MSKNARLATVAWLLTAIYYFYQYIMRSSPGVMINQLSEGFGLSALGVASMVGFFYYGYSPFSLVAGAAIDRLGPKKVIPAGAVVVGIGALLFSSGNHAAGIIGRFMQGAGGVFALIGAIYIASRHFPASRAATMIGATQMFGMAGGSAGQFAIGPLISGGASWKTLWICMGFAGLIIGAVLWIMLPKEDKPVPSDNSFKDILGAFKTIFKNPQSILCGIIAGLIFIPTTIFDMIWGVRYLQDAHGFDYATAVLRSATVPFGWIIGCPLLGFISDRIGRRKPVIITSAAVLLICLAWILFGIPGILPPYIIGLVAGIASGSAMITYTVIKEANPPQLSGTATGVINFINFTFSALLGPVFAWLLTNAASKAAKPELAHFQASFLPLLFGVALAIILTFLLKETGSAVKKIQEAN